MSVTSPFSEIMVGDEVFGSDGEKLGRVAEVAPGYITVEKGFFFPTDYFIPRTAVQQTLGGQVYLTVSKDAALNSGWDAIPGDLDVAAASDQVIGMQPTVATGGDGWATQAVEGEEIRIPLAEEELTATVRPAEVGAVRASKRVVTEDRVLDVPVTEEQIRVERRIVDRPVDSADADAFEQIVVEIPLRDETVDVRKEARVTEEVVISKEAVQRTEHVAGTVRREELYIDEDSRVEEVNP